MTSHRGPFSAQRKPRASKKRDQGLLLLVVYSTAVRSDPSQESGLKVLRKQIHKSEEAHAFHDFERASRIESLSRNTRLLEQKKYVQIHCPIPPRANLTCVATESSTSTTIEECSRGRASS